MLALVCLLCRVVQGCDGLCRVVMPGTCNNINHQSFYLKSAFIFSRKQSDCTIHFSYIHNLLKIINIQNIYYIPTCGCQTTETENIKEEMPDKVTMRCN